MSYWNNRYYRRVATKLRATNQYYALREKGTTRYWDGGAVPKRMPRAYSPASFVNKWVPKFTTDIRVWTKREDAVSALTEYVVNSSHADQSHPELELVAVGYDIAVRSAETVEVAAKALEQDRLLADFGIVISEAYGKLDIPAEDAEAFSFVVKRRGKSKAIMDAADLSGSASYGVYTFLRTENDALHAKLLLGDHFDKLYRIR